MSTEALELEIPQDLHLMQLSGSLQACAVDSKWGFVETIEEGLCLVGYTNETFGWKMSDLPITPHMFLLVWVDQNQVWSQVKVFYDWTAWSDFIRTTAIHSFLTVMISRSWTQQYEGGESLPKEQVSEGKCMDEWSFQKPLAFGAEMLKDLLQVSVSPFERNLKIKKWVYVVVDAFYDWRRSIFVQAALGGTRTEEEQKRIERIAAQLVADFSIEPKGVAELSRLAAMSATKFKCLFKRIYGMAVYEYYQLHRMRYAAELLMGGKYSVHEVGKMIGYQNMSHFAAAFKKIHGKLPGQVLGLK